MSEVEDTAKGMGWLPKEDFRGDVANWVDAGTYVKRGQEFIPFLKAENRKLETKVSSLEGQLTQLNELVKSSAETVAALKEYNTEQNRRQAALDKKDLVEGIKTAREEGNVDKEIELRTQLTATTAALEAAKVKPTEPVKPTQPVPPEWNAWVAENDWWNTNEEMRAVAVAVAAEMARKKEITEATPLSERFKLVGDKVKKMYAEPLQRRPDKVSGGKGGGGQNLSQGRDYNDLPADAKAACDKFSSDPRMVGPKKAFKTADEFRKKYLNDYFGAEA